MKGTAVLPSGNTTASKVCGGSGCSVLQISGFSSLVCIRIRVLPCSSKKSQPLSVPTGRRASCLSEGSHSNIGLWASELMEFPPPIVNRTMDEPYKRTTSSALFDTSDLAGWRNRFFISCLRKGISTTAAMPCSCTQTGLPARYIESLRASGAS